MSRQIFNRFSAVFRAPKKKNDWDAKKTRPPHSTIYTPFPTRRAVGQCRVWRKTSSAAIKKKKKTIGKKNKRRVVTRPISRWLRSTPTETNANDDFSNEKKTAVRTSRVNVQGKKNGWPENRTSRSVDRAPRRSQSPPSSGRKRISFSLPRIRVSCVK